MLCNKSWLLNGASDAARRTPLRNAMVKERRREGKEHALGLGVPRRKAL